MSSHCLIMTIVGSEGVLQLWFVKAQICGQAEETRYAVKTSLRSGIPGYSLVNLTCILFFENQSHVSLARSYPCHSCNLSHISNTPIPHMHYGECYINSWNLSNGCLQVSLCHSTFLKWYLLSNLPIARLLRFKPYANVPFSSHLHNLTYCPVL